MWGITASASERPRSAEMSRSEAEAPPTFRDRIRSEFLLGGDVGGAVVIQGTVTSTGYRSTSAPADPSKLDSDDLLQGGSAVVVNGNVAGGILLDSKPVDADPNQTDEDHDGIPDASETNASVVSFGVGSGDDDRFVVTGHQHRRGPILDLWSRPRNQGHRQRPWRLQRNERDRAFDRRDWPCGQCRWRHERVRNVSATASNASATAVHIGSGGRFLRSSSGEAFQLREAATARPRPPSSSTAARP